MSDLGSSAIFERRTALALAWIGGSALAVSLFFLVFADPRTADETSWHADSFSRSAIGYHALARFLDSEVPVLVSRAYSAAKADAKHPLLLLEPPDAPALQDMVVAALGRGAPVVVVLPKWRGEPMATRPRWVRSVELLPPAMPVEMVRAALGKEAPTGFEILRLPDETTSWSSPLLGEGQSAALALAEPRQLLRDERRLFEPLAATGDHLLVAKAAGASLYVVADPDLLNTRGLARGENAVLVHRLLIEHLAPTAIVIDESLHGYRQATSVWRALLEYPLVTLSLHLSGLAALVLWAGSARFGRPLEPPPRVPPGKRTLVDNTARLFGLREHLKDSLERYFRLTVALAAERLRAGGRPTVESGFRQQMTALSRLGRRRGTRADIEDLGRLIARLPRDGLDARHVLELSRDLYHWRKEIVDGEPGSPSRR